MRDTTKVEWILRVAMCGEFLGHGVFALQAKQSWIPYFTSVGISKAAATTLLPLIGALDIAVAVLALVFPFRLLLMWGAFWGFATALIRPVAGEPVWDFFERWANIGVPLGLLYLRRLPKNLKE